MDIDDKVLVASHCVHARGGSRNLAVERGDPELNCGPDCRFIRWMDVPVNSGWRAIFAHGVDGNFWLAGFVRSWKPVKQWAFGRLPYEDRENPLAEGGVLVRGLSQNITRRETVRETGRLGTSSLIQGPAAITSDRAW